MYGMDNLIEGTKNSKSEWVIDQLMENLTNFTQGKKQSDDTTVIEICFKCLQAPKETTDKAKSCTYIFNSNWKLDYSFQPTILKSFDPIPNIIQPPTRSSTIRLGIASS